MAQNYTKLITCVGLATCLLEPLSGDTPHSFHNPISSWNWRILFDFAGIWFFGMNRKYVCGFYWVHNNSSGLQLHEKQFSKFWWHLTAVIDVLFDVFLSHFNCILYRCRALTIYSSRARENWVNNIHTHIYFTYDGKRYDRFQFCFQNSIFSHISYGFLLFSSPSMLLWSRELYV